LWHPRQAFANSGATWLSNSTSAPAAIQIGASHKKHIIPGHAASRLLAILSLPVFSPWYQTRSANRAVCRAGSNRLQGMFQFSQKSHDVG
jgi:hypothetical protein